MGSEAPLAEAAAVGPKVRDARIDAARGVAIALIIVQHLGWAYLLYEQGAGLSPSFAGTWADLSRLGMGWYYVLAWSAPFCVAVFAFLAGYLLVPTLDRGPWAFLKARFLGLMVPFVAWSAVYALYPPADRFFLGRGNVLQFARDSLLHPTGSVAGPVWFLEVLFISTVIAYALHKTRGGNVVLFVSAAAAFLPQAFGYLGVPVTVPSWLVGINAIHPYVIAGILIRRRARLWPAPSWRLALVSVLVYALSFRLRGWLGATLVELPANWKGAAMALVRDDLSTLILALVGIWMVMCVLVLVPDRAIGAPAFVGRYSLGIMGAQLPVIATLVALDVRTPWVVFPVTLATGVLLSWLLDRTAPTRMLFLGGRRAAGRSEAPATRDTLGVEARS